MKQRTILIAAAALALPACTSGGGSGDTETTWDPLAR
jgi:hypothetical protein